MTSTLRTGIPRQERRSAGTGAPRPAAARRQRRLRNRAAERRHERRIRGAGRRPSSSCRRMHRCGKSGCPRCREAINSRGRRRLAHSRSTARRCRSCSNGWRASSCGRSEQHPDQRTPQRGATCTTFRCDVLFGRHSFGVDHEVDARRRCRPAAVHGIVRPDSRREAAPRRSARRESALHAFGRHGTQRHDRDQPAARVGGRAGGAAERRQRNRRRGHRRGGALGRRADDERHRRRSVRDRLQREDKKLHALNASGRSAYAATPEDYAKRGLRRMPGAGVLSVSVPGVVDGWSSCSRSSARCRWRRRSTPAIGYAKNGYAGREIISDQWKAVEKKLAGDPAAASTFLPGGHAPKPGEIFSNPQLAASLELIAKGGRDAFYKGPIAEAIAADMKRRDGLLTARDFADHRPTGSNRSRRTTAATTYTSCRRTRRASSTLEMLNILEGFDIKALGHNSAAYLHLLVEAKRIAFADRARVARRSRLGAAGRARSDDLEGVRCARAARRSIRSTRRTATSPARSAIGGPPARRSGRAISPATIAATRST